MMDSEVPDSNNKNNYTWRNEKWHAGILLLSHFPVHGRGIQGWPKPSTSWGDWGWCLRLWLSAKLSLEIAQDVIKLLVHLCDLFGNQKVYGHTSCLFTLVLIYTYLKREWECLTSLEIEIFCTAIKWAPAPSQTQAKQIQKQEASTAPQTTVLCTVLCLG